MNFLLGLLAEGIKSKTWWHGAALDLNAALTPSWPGSRSSSIQNAQFSFSFASDFHFLSANFVPGPLSLSLVVLRGSEVASLHRCARNVFASTGQGCFADTRKCTERRERKFRAVFSSWTRRCFCFFFSQVRHLRTSNC